jgi:hypothetical protein
MSSLYAHFYAGTPFQALPVFALVLFLGTFVAVVIRASISWRRREVDAAETLPFDPNERIAGSSPSPRSQP